MSALRRRYGHARAGSNYEKRTIHGVVSSVYATGGQVHIDADDGEKYDLRIMSRRYWADSHSGYKAALRVQKQVGRRVIAEIEYHPAFGWAIFGGSNIRLEK